MHKSAEHKLPPDEKVAQTEILFQTAISDLRANHDTDVDFELLSSLVDMYHKFYDVNKIVEKRWLGYTEEIIKLLEDAEHKAAAELKQMIDTDRPMKAYQKAIDTSNNEG